MSVRDELREQPEAVRRLLDGGVDATAAVAERLGRSEVDHVVIAARGTSDNVARYAQYVWGSRNRLAVTLTTPSLFGTYARPVDLRGAVVVVISQSGQSPDLLAVAEEGRRQDRPVVAVTNDAASPLARLADLTIDLRAGPERAVAATKTYTASLVAVAMISDLLDGGALSSDVRGLPDVLGQALEAPGPERLAHEVRGPDRLVVLGRGWHLATAHEWALKIQELTGVMAQPWSTADFEHGPIAAVTAAVPVLAVSVRDPAHEATCALLDRLARERHAPVVLVTDDGQAGVADARVLLPGDRPAWLTPIVAAPVIQRFAIGLAQARGADPDAPRGLQKVTRTR